MFMRVQARSRRPGDQDPMGEIQKRPFQLSFNASLRVDFQGSRVTFDGGLILVRELDERLGFGELAAECLIDTRARNGQLPIADLPCQSVYSRLAGYEDVNDAERLAQDPSFRLIGSEKIWDRGAALPSRLQSFEAQMLAEDGNFSGLARLNRELADKAEALDSGYRTVLDMDSTEIPVYGEQELLPIVGAVNVARPQLRHQLLHAEMPALSKASASAPLRPEIQCQNLDGQLGSIHGRSMRR